MFSGKLHSEKFELMKRSIESQRNLLTIIFAENKSVNRTNYKIGHKMAKQGTPFTDGVYVYWKQKMNVF